MSEEASTCIVIASGGYPGSYPKGKPISGISDADQLDGIKVFHAGTRSQNGQIVSSGGRVLGVTALGDSLESALDQAYRATQKISFDGAFYRSDIGAKAIEAMS